MEASPLSMIVHLAEAASLCIVLIHSFVCMVSFEVVLYPVPFEPNTI